MSNSPAPTRAPSRARAAPAGSLDGALFTTMESPVGRLVIAGEERSLWTILMEDQRWAPEIGSDWRSADEPFAAARDQLEEYFAGERTEFDLPLRIEGTPFRVRVWEELRRIPFGATRTYREIAVRIGRPGAFRAVGLANGRNPFAIVLPCHRVIGADGALVGYGGGLQRKRQLLDHEAGVLSIALP